MTSMIRAAAFRQREEAEECHLLGDARSITQLRQEIQTAGRSDAKVLITGETGVGKEVVAKLVHQSSHRRVHPFIAINCAALPDTLLESELFGYLRGSFTDAYQDRPGLAMLADRGTLFLDEVGEMSPRMQAVLLRFVETREIHRLGADRSRDRVDVRIITATNRNLLERVASGDFRQDLYYRLNVIQIGVPALRERGEDIKLLFDHFLEKYSRSHKTGVPEIAPGTYDRLLAYGWPGNVRELKNVAERIVVRHTGGVVAVDDLPLEIRAAGSTLQASAAATMAGDVPVRHTAGERAWHEIVVEGKSFWTAVHPLFIERELTKSDVRFVVKRGLEQTQGSYRKLVDVLRMAPQDYKRFLAFLYQHDCHVAFHPFRETRERADAKPTRAVGD